MTRPGFASVALCTGSLLFSFLTPASAQVTFLSRSGESSYFAAGVHGYQPAFHPVRLVSEDKPRSMIRPDSLEDRRVWRETTRYEYLPPRLLRHGNHYDMVPGGYELRRSGYWTEW